VTSIIMFCITTALWAALFLTMFKMHSFIKITLMWDSFGYTTVYLKYQAHKIFWRLTEPKNMKQFIFCHFLLITNMILWNHSWMSAFLSITGLLIWINTMKNILTLLGNSMGDWV
jgi:hypothetical protein